MLFCSVLYLKLFVLFGKLKENFRKLKQNFRKLKQNPQKLNLPEIPFACVAAKSAKK